MRKMIFTTWEATNRRTGRVWGNTRVHLAGKMGAASPNGTWPLRCRQSKARAFTAMGNVEKTEAQFLANPCKNCLKLYGAESGK